nr:MAG TPA: hypothetical protein [Caudoviricetes sp.]
MTAGVSSPRSSSGRCAPSRPEGPRYGRRPLHRATTTEAPRDSPQLTPKEIPQ